jgi:Glycosyltransferase family 28 C-terminal domain/Monogalactosyldiacylglycerol (MGDG) synthase
MPTVDFVFFDAGGGHRAAATALKAVIDQQNRGWNVRLVNLQELLDALDIFRKITGIRLEDIYNHLLAKGWTLGSGEMLKAMHGLFRLYHRPAVKLLERHWAETKPDMVVSLVPNFNRAMREGLRNALPSTPYVTILTDFADYPPHFWIERQEQYLICGTERAVQQARASGFREDQVFGVSGMILRPTFYERVTVDRAAERRKLDLDPERPTGLVLFGGLGSNLMLDIASKLNASDAGVQLILICGRNEKLAQRLRAMPKNIPMHVEGFTANVAHFMRLADFFVGKPGPGSISEAVAMKLPVIIERNAWTMPQERYNAEWVKEKRAGVVLPNFRGIDEAVTRMLTTSEFAGYKASVEKIENRAVFEIPDILAGILRG